MSRPKKTESVAKQLARKMEATKHLTARQAKADFDFFCTQVERGGLVVTSAGCDANLKRLRLMLAAAYPASDESQARELASVAELLEDQAGLVGAKTNGYRRFAKQLRLEADAMVAGAWRSPWETPDILELLTPGEKVISAALWRCNKHRETTWTIPLDVFCREGWGDADTRIETVKPRVSKLVKKLNELGVELSVTVRNSKALEQVECSFVPKYQGFSFPRKP